MPKIYKCPFCGESIEDSVDSLVAHREPGGKCDQNMAASEPS